MKRKKEARHTEFLPEEGENLAGVKLSRKTSDRGQRLATISLCDRISAIVGGITGSRVDHRHRKCDGIRARLDRWCADEEPTLNANMDVVLDLFDITGVVVGFGEGVCGKQASVSKMNQNQDMIATPKTASAKNTRLVEMHERALRPIKGRSHDETAQHELMGGGSRKGQRNIAPARSTYRKT